MRWIDDRWLTRMAADSQARGAVESAAFAPSTNIDVSIVVRSAWLALVVVARTRLAHHECGRATKRDCGAMAAGQRSLCHCRRRNSVASLTRSTFAVACAPIVRI